MADVEASAPTRSEGIAGGDRCGWKSWISGSSPTRARRRATFSGHGDRSAIPIRAHARRGHRGERWSIDARRGRSKVEFAGGPLRAHADVTAEEERSIGARRAREPFLAGGSGERYAPARGLGHLTEYGACLGEARTKCRWRRTPWCRRRRMISATPPSMQRRRSAPGGRSRADDGRNDPTVRRGQQREAGVDRRWSVAGGGERRRSGSTGSGRGTAASRKRRGDGDSRRRPTVGPPWPTNAPARIAGAARTGARWRLRRSPRQRAHRRLRRQPGPAPPQRIRRTAGTGRTRSQRPSRAAQAGGRRRRSPLSHPRSGEHGPPSVSITGIRPRRRSSRLLCSRLYVVLRPKRMGTGTDGSSGHACFGYTRASSLRIAG